MRRCFILPLLALLMLATTTSAQTAYRKPPQVVADVLDAAANPTVSVSPTRDFLALVQSARYPGIAEVSEPMLRLAGVRLNPKTNGPARQGSVTSLAFLKLADQSKVVVKLPAGKVSSPDWSHDGKRFAITVTTGDGIRLWVGTVADGSLSEIMGVRVNAAMGDGVQWLNNDELLVEMIPEKRGKPPEAPTAPIGPVVQESSGKAAPVRTFQDLLTSAHDEALFEYYGTSQLAILKLDGTMTKLGEPAIITGMSPSPTGKYLLVTRLKKPFSYLYTYSAFPKVTEVWDRSGKVVHTVADLPLQDKVPIEGVPTGPRGIRWVAGETDELVWAEALDGGDPKAKVPHRDELFRLAAPFATKPMSAYKTEHRFGGLSFLRAGNWLVTDLDRERKWTRTVVVEPDSGKATVSLFDRSINDRYNDPGSPVTVPLANGQRVVLVREGSLYLSSAGATPKGELPTLKTFRPDSKETKTIFQCRDGMYESVVAIIDFEKNTFLIRRESPTEPPNYFLRTGNQEIVLTDNKDPFPELRKVKKQLVKTKRKDGVEISFTLYTPPGLKDGEKLPTVFWAYPREFNDAATAGQVTGSPFRFTTLGGYSHLFLLTQGYAVMDEVSMPIVGKPESANDTFIDQLVSTAEAAIEKACEVGPVDRDRIGVGGHSYGAFMTANLLAHSDLFRAGIARSGAYNRTLTPFGFQNERRTFWEAPEVYGKMSPFFNAPKVNEPLLLIHGQADSNPGTFPVQSERMYQAVRGNGGTVRLVLLPHEDHGYAARESIGHVLAEQIQWFDTHVKNAKPRQPKGTGEK
ncbi:MAG: prolyl oligopeptidase family serine peptidase [Fimbriiglobus sp.]|nr:prolyl oligopeptidase family serine peptidase [Fimbriiglobus sp.]